MAAPPVISTARVGSVAILTLESSPVNCLDRPVRRALLAALERSEHDPGVHAVVITGSRNFSAGADLAEFDNEQGLAEPTLHLTIAGYLDAMTKPSVAAIYGAALGGGLELALACTARVAHPEAKLGLPETTLGFMPGAGGTQRLPRSVGMEAAVDLIVTGRTIRAGDARSLGLVDVVDSDPVKAAIELASSLTGDRKRRLRDEPISEPMAEAIVNYAKRAAERSPHTNAGVVAALDALMAAVQLPFDQGLAKELALFEQLAAQPEAKAARYRFLSDRHAGKNADSPDILPVRTAAVVGAGTMGRGIALALLSVGIAVTLIDTESDRVDAGAAAIKAEVDRAAARGRVSDHERHLQLSALTTAVGLDNAGGVDLVIEAVFEDMDVKQEVFRRLDAVVSPETILASNTSSLDLNVLAAMTSHPERVVGMHFFSPASVMKLVEVVDGKETSTSILATVVALVRRMGKLPVIAQVGPGFIGNRLFDQYLRQAQLLLLSGVSPQRIDHLLEEWGMAMGPFRVLDLVGNDIPWLARKAANEPDPAWRIADEVCQNGWFGRKSGTGWYMYGDDGTITPNPGVDELIRPFAATATVTDEDIVLRCIFAFVNEAAAALADGIAAGTADVDTVLVNGYGFPRRRGGAWFFAENYDWNRVVDAMERWKTETADPFWEPHPTIQAKVEGALR
ncbi:3-hydroxyacyl-CoA dehydrogenase NAD-binding domain-containing protein [Arthrobacter sp. 2MCAF15]|uniref:3-hydroxyacyl-CoA dehydrogenase NAD-binding domain-containing protein n=1 Tax=Arthrobacter sp. 2MCAF15 TaxID=3232984 RepID=UPI003F934AAD